MYTYCLAAPTAPTAPSPTVPILHLQEGTYCSLVGSCTAWFEPYVAPAVGVVAGPAAASSWAGSALLPATLAYTTVKGFGWNDWGNEGLNELEKKMNGVK